MNNCYTCTKAFNKYLRKPVTCLRCNATTCKSCIIENIIEKPSCVQCNYEFDDEFIDTYFTKSFITNDMKNHRMKALFDREEQFLPQTQSYITYELKMREVKELMKREQKDFKLIEKQHKAKMSHYKHIIHNWETNHIMVDDDIKYIEDDKKIINSNSIIQLPDISHIKNLPVINDATDALIKYHKILEHIQLNEISGEHTESSKFMENIDDRIKYSLDEYSKDDFIKIIYNHDKTKNKNKDKCDVFKKVLSEGIVLFEALLDNPDCCIESVAATIVLFDDLLSSGNNALSNISKKYNCKMPSIIKDEQSIRLM